MEENKKKASDKNIDPAEKALLMQLIEEEGEKLKTNLEKQKEIDKKFSYDPSQHVTDLLKKMKESIEKKGRSNSNNSGSGNRNNHNQSDSDDSDTEDDDNPLEEP